MQWLAANRRVGNCAKLLDTDRLRLDPLQQSSKLSEVGDVLAKLH